MKIGASRKRLRASVLLHGLAQHTHSYLKLTPDADRFYRVLTFIENYGAREKCTELIVLSVMSRYGY